MMNIMENWRLPLILLVSIGSGLSGGIFFAFSTFVMQALAKLPSSQGIAAMQAINITVINPWFMTAFFAPGVAGILLSISLFFHWEQSLAAYWLTGSLLYLIGTIGVTIFGNVPLNNLLATVTPDSVEGTNLWTRYLRDWIFWNHVRTAAALLSATLFTIAFYLRTNLIT